MSPRVFCCVAVFFNLAACLIVGFIELRQGHGITHEFLEGDFSTFLSCANLLLTAFFAWRTLLERRRQTPWTGWRTPWLLWPLLSAAFVYLAADDALRFHELLDKIIHKTFHITETGLTDRLDDAIIGLYAVAGLGVLYAYRRELMLVRPSLPYFVWGFVLTFVQVIFDALGDRDDVLKYFFQDPALVHRLRDLLEVAEGVTEALAEGLFLAAFYCAWHVTRQRSREAR